MSILICITSHKAPHEQTVKQQAAPRNRVQSGDVDQRWIIRSDASDGELMEKLSHHRAIHSVLWLTTVVSILALTAAIWLPVGTYRTGFIEEWGFFANFDAGQPFYDISILQAQPNRVLSSIPYYLAYHLIPDSFAGLNFVIWLLFIGKALLFFGIIRRLFPQIPAIALMAALLYVIYPADTSIVGTRPTSYMWTIFFLLMAQNLLFIYAQRPRLAILLGMWIAQAMSLFSVETTLPFVILSPLLLWFQHRKFKRSLTRITLLWLIVPALATLVLLLLLGRTTSYQAGVLNYDTGLQGQRYLVYIVFIVIAEFRSFIHAWIEAFELASIYVHPAIVIASLAAVSVVTISGLLIFRTLKNQPQQISRRKFGRFAFAGTVVVAIGFSPFLPQPSRSGFERTYLLASMGAVITVLMVLFILSRSAKHKNTVFTLVAGFVLGIALLAAEGRNQQMFDYSVHQQRILSEFVQQMPAFDDKGVILLFDPTNGLKHTQWVFATNTGSRLLESALQFLYRDYQIHIWLCYPGELEHDAFPERCEVDAQGVHLFSNAMPPEYYPYSRVMAFEYDPVYGDVKLLDKLPDAYFSRYAITTYDPHKLVNPAASPPARVNTLLANWLMQKSSDHPAANSISQASSNK